MENPPFGVTKNLDGWGLFWAKLFVEKNSPEMLAQIRRTTEKQVLKRYDIKSLSTHPVVSGLRSLFRATGCDPTRYRPSSEALLRRILKGNKLPTIHPLVDINNCLSARLAIPCCVMAAGTFEPPIELRAGRPGESYDSLKGLFKLEKKPLLTDQNGPLDAPITGSKRVMVKPETKEAWLVSYFPEGVLEASHIADSLSLICDASDSVTIDRISVI